MRDILGDASAMSVVIVNEIFSSTTFDDALFLGQQVLEAVGQLGLVAVYVTFIEELASYSDATVSMVASVDPADPTVRTYKVVRQAADGLAYAISIVQKYGLDSDQLRRRLLR
jgi:DNA mismatch repair protein MutS